MLVTQTLQLHFMSTSQPLTCASRLTSARDTRGNVKWHSGANMALEHLTWVYVRLHTFFCLKQLMNILLWWHVGVAVTRQTFLQKIGGLIVGTKLYWPLYYCVVFFGKNMLLQTVSLYPAVEMAHTGASPEGLKCDPPITFYVKTVPGVWIFSFINVTSY